ncbi:MAG: DUF1761 family protein [Actinomycetota bacterium]
MNLPWIGILAAGAAGFVSSFLWFGPKTFFPLWWRLMGKGDEVPGGGQSMPITFALSFVASVAQAAAVAGIMSALGPGDLSPVGAAGAGLIAGLAVASASLGHRLFGGHGVGVWAIEAGSDVVNLVVMSAVLSFWF